MNPTVEGTVGGIWATITAALAGIGQFLWNVVLPVALIVAVGILVITLLMKALGKLMDKAKLEKTAQGLIKTAVRTVLYGLLCLIIASRLGVDVTGIIALASVLTLAISLSVQTALTNVISGFTLLYTKPFVGGDFVEIAGQSGTVQSIGLTYTKLITADNKTVFIPNSSVTSNDITNYTVLGKRRVDVTVAVSYDNDAENVIAAMLEAGNVPTALEEHAPFAAVKEYGESTVSYVLHVWCSAGDYWTTLFDVNKKVREVFAEKGVKMTYPHLNIHMDK